MYFLTEKLEFPPVNRANSEGLLAVGGDLSPERLILAYRSGIFPWFNEDSLILWWSPDPRMVLFPNKVRISRSMRKLMNSGVFEIRVNTAFEEVIDACASIKRSGQEGTWITDQMKNAYLRLYKLGVAKSYEVWQDNELVGACMALIWDMFFAGKACSAMWIMLLNLP